MAGLQAGAPLVGRSPLLQRATGDTAYLCLARDQVTLDPLEEAFEEDLANWLVRLYAVRAERLLMSRLERVYGVGWLAVTAATLIVPLAGGVAALVAVAVMVVTLVVAWTTATRGSHVRPQHKQSVSARGTTVWIDHPAFGSDERAQLVRLMNLSHAAWRPATRMLLRAELREARSRGPLASWGALYDLEDVVLADAFAAGQWRA
jgi:hypothetical protein